MPSLQIKDYIIAGLLITLIGVLSVLGYYKADAAIANSTLANIKVLKDEAERKTKLITKRTEQERIEANEQYQSDIASLNVELKRMRDSSPSILPAVTKATRNPNQINFEREKLDRAIQEYRSEIQRLVAEGAACEIEIKTLQHWWYNVQSLYAQ